MAILCDLIKKNKWEILKTFDGYKICTNGYGDFKYIETAGIMDEEKVIKAATIYAKLEHILKEA